MPVKGKKSVGKRVAAKKGKKKIAAKPKKKVSKAVRKSSAGKKPRVTAKRKAKVAKKPKTAKPKKAKNVKAKAKGKTKSEAKATKEAEPQGHRATRAVGKSAANKNAAKSKASAVLDKVIPLTTKKLSTKKSKEKHIESGRPTEVAVSKQRSISDEHGGIAPYQEQPGEEYMNQTQCEHFRMLLNQRRQELMEEVDRTKHHMQDEAGNLPDPNDRATQEEEFGLELRARDRERKLIKKIEEALQRLDNNEYGYCEACGVEIGVRRLEARPTATLCIDCKTLDEIKEKQTAA